MRITKGKLRQIIREELQRLNEVSLNSSIAPGWVGDMKGGGTPDGDINFHVNSPRGLWVYALRYPEGEPEMNMPGTQPADDAIYVKQDPTDSSVSPSNPLKIDPRSEAGRAVTAKMDQILHKTLGSKRSDHMGGSFDDVQAAAYYAFAKDSFFGDEDWNVSRDGHQTKSGDFTGNYKEGDPHGKTPMSDIEKAERDAAAAGLRDRRPAKGADDVDDAALYDDGDVAVALYDDDD